MGSIGFPELIVILLILVVLFGAGKLPELGKGLGKAISNFKTGMRESHEEDKNQLGSSAKENERH